MPTTARYWGLRSIDIWLGGNGTAPILNLPHIKSGTRLQYDSTFCAPLHPPPEAQGSTQLTDLLSKRVLGERDQHATLTLVVALGAHRNSEKEYAPVHVKRSCLYLAKDCYDSAPP